MKGRERRTLLLLGALVAAAAALAVAGVTTQPGEFVPGCALCHAS